MTCVELVDTSRTNFVGHGLGLEDPVLKTHLTW